MSIIMNKNTQVVPYQGNDKLLLGIVLGVITFCLFAQTTLNIAPTMQAELGITENWSNIAVSIQNSIVIRKLYCCPSHVCDKVCSENGSERWPAYYIISSVRTIPYIIVAVVSDTMMSE